MASISAYLQPLIVLLGQAERERDELGAAARATAAAQQSTAAQSDQLLTYRREYEQRWNTQFRTDGRMELVNCYHGFMDRLTVAVEHQRRATAQAAERHELALVRLREAETRVASVRKLIERRNEEIRRAGERLEQKQSDEFAARSAWNRTSGFHAANLG